MFLKVFKKRINIAINRVFYDPRARFLVVFFFSKTCTTDTSSDTKQTQLQTPL